MHSRKKLQTIEAFFAGKEEYLPTFHRLRESIGSLGDVKTEVTKTQVSFGTDRKFAWVWFPPFRVKGRPEKYFVLTFGLDHRIRHDLIAEAVEPHPKRWTHHVIIERGSEPDETVRLWLKEAYELSRHKSKS